ncbi:hypothetical protein [Metabacillus schmidteae]|uniref:hypothetical protein n=1 Tax=Metabacillus schmidteae TaxID=2730405 RepID=UPI00158D071B|nr:hypothetical protein [Metabacillus schmidteae]
MPKLTSKQAFSVIYYLQEALGVIPDVYEKCDECDSLFDTDNSGHYNETKGKFYCSSCTHLHDFEETDEGDKVG